MARTPDGALIGEPLFKNVGISAGGYVTSISMSADGVTKAISTDVYNSYVWDAALDEWRPLFSPDTLAASEYDPFPTLTSSVIDGSGGCGVAVAPSDNTRIVAAWRGYFYFSTDGGETLTRGNLAAKRMFANTGTQRNWNDRVAISPANAAHVLLGTTNDGVYYTTDFGATISAVGGTIPANATQATFHTPYLVAFGPGGTTCYIYVQGTGLYRSTTGVSGTFTAVGGTGAPVGNAATMHVDALGAVWIASLENTGAVFKFESSAWTTTMVRTNFGPRILTVNPNNTNQVIAMNTDGQTLQSLDRGATFVGGQQWQWTFPAPVGIYVNALDDVAWLEGSTQFPSKLMFNPAESNELWCSQGLGVNHSTPPTTFVRWDWYSQSRGIFELVCSNFLSIPGRDGALCNFWDKPNWKLGDDPSAFNMQPKWTAPGQSIEHAWQSAYAADDVDYVLVAQGYTGDTSGYSEDAGNTFVELFPSGLPSGQAGGNGGACAVGNRAQQVLIAGNNMRAIATHDEWATWDYLPIDPNIGGLGYWINASYIRRDLVTADHETPGTFAIVMNGSNQGTGVHGLWVTKMGPLGTWTRKVAGRIDSTGDSVDFWHCKLAYIPGHAGELIYTTGKDFDSRLLHFTDDANSGASTVLGSAWGITRVVKFGFGKAKPGATYPAIFFYGRVSGVAGLYVSYDFFGTEPALLARFPNGRIDSVSAVSGDMNIFGRVYVGFSGSGAVYGDFRDVRTQA